MKYLAILLISVFSLQLAISAQAPLKQTRRSTEHFKAKKALSPADIKQKAIDVTNRLDEQLDLNPRQKRKIQVINRNAIQEKVALKMDAKRLAPNDREIIKAKRKSIQNKRSNAIKDVLNRKQVQKFEKLQAERNQMRMKKLKHKQKLKSMKGYKHAKQKANKSITK